MTSSYVNLLYGNVMMLVCKENRVRAINHFFFHI